MAIVQPHHPIVHGRCARRARPLEEPDALLRQAIREMESRARSAHPQQLKALELDRESAAPPPAVISSATGSIREELDLSFAAGNETLVRTCLRRRLEGERLLRQLEQRQSTLTQRIEQSTPVLEQQRERLESMRLKAALFDVDIARAAPTAAAGTASTAVSARPTSIWRLLREQQARRAP